MSQPYANKLALPPVPAGENGAAAYAAVLTDIEARVVALIILGHSKIDVGIGAGVSERGVFDIISRPHVAQAIRQRMAQQLVVEAPAIALATLMEIAGDKSAPKTARVAASNSLLDRAGYVSRAPAGGEDGKSLNELTFSQLQQRIESMNKAKLDLEADQSAIPGEARTIPIDDPFS
jgi:hypothetical protein